MENRRPDTLAGMANGSGSIRRRRLGIELRELRTAKGLTLDEVARRFTWSVSKASRMERGLVPVSPRDVADLVKLYGVDDPDHADALVAMAAASRQRDWWHKFDDLLPRQFSVYLGFEGDAESIHTYQSLLIPGLLQTEAYARAIFRAAQPGETDEQINRRVEARLLRQTIVKNKDAPRLWAILDEAAIRRGVGGRDVMREQLAHLASSSKQPNITIQVIPFRAGAYMSMDGGFIILRFAEAEDPDVVCVDIRTRSLYVDDPAEVRRYTLAHEQLLALAATPDESIKLIEAALEEMR
ncbi:helix-turn-helix domain-containing protein [Micromonospora sp. LOL_014]|mgnify:CR=1 FL=1|uniref:helix-turn-helix domain-containing protein n=1 Tax=Micromonospora sp. LOL_014 TaxID=3345415 RepID=UPI003A87D3D2